MSDRRLAIQDAIVICNNQGIILFADHNAVHIDIMVQICISHAHLCTHSHFTNECLFVSNWIIFFGALLVLKACVTLNINHKENHKY